MTSPSASIYGGGSSLKLTTSATSQGSAASSVKSLSLASLSSTTSSLVKVGRDKSSESLRGRFSDTAVAKNDTRPQKISLLPPFVFPTNNNGESSSGDNEVSASLTSDADIETTCMKLNQDLIFSTSNAEATVDQEHPSDPACAAIDSCASLAFTSTTDVSTNACITPASSSCAVSIASGSSSGSGSQDDVYGWEETLERSQSLDIENQKRAMFYKRAHGKRQSLLQRVLNVGAGRTRSTSPSPRLSPPSSEPTVAPISPEWKPRT